MDSVTKDIIIISIAGTTMEISGLGGLLDYHDQISDHPQAKLKAWHITVPRGLVCDQMGWILHAHYPLFISIVNH